MGGQALAACRTKSPQDRVAQTEMLRLSFGEDHDREMSDMRIGAQHLFATPDGMKTNLGSLAQVPGIQLRDGSS